MVDAERLTNLIDHYITEDGMNYESAHKKAWDIVNQESEERRAKLESDMASRSVVI